MAEFLNISSLDDAPLLKDTKTADTIPNPIMQLSAFVSELLEDADAEGYAIVNVGRLQEGLMRIMKCKIDVLSDSPWLMHTWLEQGGAIMAPDPTLEKRRLRSDDVAVIYRSPLSSPCIRTRNYKKALLFVKYITLVFQILTQDELAEAGRLIDAWVKDERYRRHLRALLRWYNVRRRLLDKRTRVMHHEIMQPADKHLMTNQLLNFAAQRGIAIQPKAMLKLEKVLTHLDMNENVNVLLHRMHCAQPLPQACVKKANPDTAVQSNKDAAIDHSVLNAIEQETEQVHYLLSDVFESEEPKEAVSETIDNQPSAEIEAIMRKLLEREHWTLEEISVLAPQQPPLLLLEAINDLAIERIDDTIIDVEGDEAYVSTAYKDLLFP